MKKKAKLSTDKLWTLKFGDGSLLSKMHEERSEANEERHRARFYFPDAKVVRVLVTELPARKGKGVKRGR